MGQTDGGLGYTKSFLKMSQKKKKLSAQLIAKLLLFRKDVPILEREHSQNVPI